MLREREPCTRAFKLHNKTLQVSLERLGRVSTLSPRQPGAIDRYAAIANASL